MAAPSPVTTIVIATSTAELQSEHSPCSTYHKYGYNLACPLSQKSAYQSSPAAPCIQHKSPPPPRCWRPLVHHVTNTSINYHPTGQPSLTTITCKLRLGAFEHIMSSATGHRHFDLHPTIIMPFSKRTPQHSAGLTKSQQIPNCLCSTPCWLPTTDDPEDHSCSR